MFAACASDDTDGDEAVTEDTSGDTATTMAEGDDTATTMAEGDDTATTMAEGDDTATTTADTEGAAPAGAVGEVGGSACGTPNGPYEAAEPAGEVRVAWNDPLLSFNNNTTHANASANANVAYLMHSGFNYYDGELNLVNNDSFGTCTIDSLDPLTITYRVNEGVTWSDGVQIDAADLILGWGSVSGQYNEGTSTFLSDGTAIQTDEEGNWLVVTPEGETRAETAEDYDAETGELLEGFEYVPAEGVQFDGSSEAYELVTEFPVVSDDGLAITMTYDSLYVDYPNVTPFGGTAAHVVAQNALGIEDPMEAKAALIAAFQDNDAATLAPIATFWSSGYDYTSLPDTEGVYVSSGMYLMTGYDELSEMTFEANPDYNWGPIPKVQTLVYRIIGDPTAAVQALANEEIDLIQPQATADILTQLEGFADRGVEIAAGDGGVYEHVDLIFDNGGPFDPATYGGDEEMALKVRQAFLKTIPRSDIVDRLIKPLNANAVVRDSFSQVPGSPPYDNLAENNGLADYADVDIAGAVALLEEAGVTTPINVRFLFAENNPRRANQFDLISASAAEAGFTLIDGRSATWGTQLSDPSSYDASLFGWQTTAVAVADTEANFVTGGQNNYGLFSSEEVDALYEELKGTTDPDRQQEILLEVESILVAEAFGIPIFQHPSIAAFNSNYVSNIDPIAISPTIFWNVWDWEAA